MNSTSNSNTSRRVPFDKRKRTETSCDKCKSRKQKCDRMLGQEQCRYCELHRLSCTTNQPRKKRIYGNIEGLGGRLVLLESLVKGLLPEADLSGNNEMQQLGKSLGIPLPKIEDTSSPSGSRELENNDKVNDEEPPIPLLPDQQGHAQYIGPASSFSFHLKLRRLIGNYSGYEFAMFGRNAAEPTEDFGNSGINIRKADLGREPEPSATKSLINAPSDYGSPSDAVREIDGQAIDSLIDTYFDIIHPDFPVLHEASFREAYEEWSRNRTANPVWLCSLLCVMMLALRAGKVIVSDGIERKWWKHIQLLLPTVFFTSSILSIQALMLAALHLHNNSHRDACWNLTGTAVRIAYAIGLHRDDVKHSQSLLGRELMKQLWWTLYAFEQMQVSSYDRPSAMESNVSSVGCPNERIIGNAQQDFTKWSQKLVVLLGSACKSLNVAGTMNTATEDIYAKPLSPVAAILRVLDRWKIELPAHLRLEVMDSVAPSSRRPLILLHIQYYYTQILMTRSALLRRATALSKNDDSPPLSQIMYAVSETCIDAGRRLGSLLLKLDTIEKFNPYTWWDIFYTVSSALVLVLDIHCRTKEQSSTPNQESQDTLRDLSNIMSRVLQDAKVPNSMRKWATVVCEVKSVADEFDPSCRSRPHSRGTNPSLIDPHVSRLDSLPTTRTLINEVGEPQQNPNHTLSHNAQTDVFSGFDSGGKEGKDEPQHFWAQMEFFDDGNGNCALQDWNWDGIEALLRAGNSI